MPPSSGHKKELAVGAITVVVVIALLAVVILTNKKSATTASTKAKPTVVARTATPTASPRSAAGSGSTSSVADAYKNGTYSATGSYDSPGGAESITISVTVQDDVVTATSATSGANDSESHEFQNDFISGYKSLVVGKPLASISLDRVSGSSLTSQGFNQALSQIKQQAQA